MTMLLSLVLGFILGAAALVFAFQNNELVSLTFLGYEFESSLAVLTLLAVLVGILISALMTLPGAIQSALRIHSLERENRKLRDGTYPVETTTVVREETVYPVTT